MKIKASPLTALLLVALLGGCNLQKEADEKFGDQHFKTAIALIELHKIRYGTYPENLEDLKFNGEWDAIALNSVEYSQLGNGYQLKITHGWMGAPQLSYPAEFWRGLGIVASNVGGAPAKPAGT